MLPALVKAATVAFPSHTAATVLSAVLTPGQCHRSDPFLHCTLSWQAALKATYATLILTGQLSLGQQGNREKHIIAQT